MRRAVALVATAACALAGLVTTGARVAAAYPGSTVELTGHGFGHGRGMGQYGALGYALRGTSAADILGHFYSNTNPGTVGNDPFTVELTAFGTFDTIVMQESGHLVVNGAAAPDKAARAVHVGTNTFRIDSAPDCAGPWSAGSTVAGPVTFSTSVVNDVRTDMLQACEPQDRRWLRGDILAVEGDGGGRTVNRLPLESYVRGVVPRESPASWGSLGGGAGQQALIAQAVAARSYGLSENRHSWAKTCDSTSCQVYGGRAVLNAGGFTDLEGTPAYANSDAAVASSAGQVRVMASGGGVARTEYSSSTGGWSAGGTFPAVVDEGDDVCVTGGCNDSHTWRASVPVSTVEHAFPGIGSLQSIDVLARNGLGDFGGRVTSVAVRGTSSSVTVSGDAFRGALGLKSDWFAVGGTPSGGVSGYWLVAGDGGIFTFGNAAFHGSTGGMRLNKPVVGMAPTPSGNGYWLVASDGGIFTFGDAPFRGSAGGLPLNRPVVGMASTPSGNGYWLVATDGGIFTYGDAPFLGSMGGTPLNKPVVGMAATPSGRGYWLVASDGGIFSFGDAAFHGSTGSLRLNRPIVGMAAGPPGGGYWLVAADGGVFTFDVPFLGSLPGINVNTEATGIAPTRSGGGYLVVSAPGAVYPFGDAPRFGGMPEAVPGYRGRILGIATHPG
jgi:SpoIID/LytB domain protein